MSAVAVDDVNPATWRDGKRYAWLLGLIVPTLPFIACGLVELTGLGLFWFYGPILVFGVFPLLDVIVGLDSENPPDSVHQMARAGPLLPLVHVRLPPGPVRGARVRLLAVGARRPLDVDKIGLALTMAMVSGIAINTAHELGHKRRQLERWLSKIALAQSGYGHFFIEHNRGHHVRVATPEDPASARLGESFWAFLPRTLAGSLAPRGSSSSSGCARRHGPWTYSNDILNAWAMTLGLYVVLIAVFGWVVLPYLLLQSVVGASLLEVVNYLEHYGLLRQKRDDGRYERTAPEHSWNSNNVASNVLLYHLQRHSDHHANPTRRYQALRHMDDAPQLPTGYAGMIVLALFPPVWRR